LYPRSAQVDLIIPQLAERGTDSLFGETSLAGFAEALSFKALNCCQKPQCFWLAK
jgi:hypothetical protein